MTGPHLLLVDDSEAILAFERAVLGGSYGIEVARGGEEALRLVHELRPSALLLDLSMPGMNGEDVLRRLKGDPATADLPVIIVTTESHRADACMRLGAADFVPKPLRADTLRAVVERVLRHAERVRDEASLGVLFARVGGIPLGIALGEVEAVLLHPATWSVPLACDHACTAFDLRGAPVLVVDLARGIGREHTARLIDRKLIVLRHEPLLAACVDDVFEPELVPPERFERGGEAEHTNLWPPASRRAVVRHPLGLVPLVEVAGLLPKSVLAAAARALQDGMRAAASARPA